MLKGLGQLAGLMKYIQDPSKLREELASFQQKVGEITAEGNAGGGMVRVVANGKGEIVSCSLSEEAFKEGDRELLEDLIRAASNQAFSRVREQVAQESTKMAAAMGIPAGFGLPGLELPGS